ncbi:MAG: hypothetical protein HQM08_27595 [Candidatus Riflebacteria bacterium]|nr:hypothetical protein [Candidatus Riflebacteria bacterium]
MNSLISHPDFLPALSISGIFLLTFLAAEVLRYYANFKIEATRKFVHMTAGIVALTFSYIFKSHWTLLILCTIFVILMEVTRKLNLLQSIHRIERRSSGSIYHPIAIYTTYCFASVLKKPEFYFISILVLSISDSLAALIGSTYGFKLYRVQEENKSIEGSTIFFFSTFIIIHIGLLLLTDIGRLESILGAIIIAICITLFEAIALHGVDNLIIPWGTLFILYRFDGLSALALVHQLFKVGTSFFFSYVLSFPSGKFGATGSMAFALFAYAAWAMIGLDWFVSALLGLILVSYTDLFIGNPKEENEIKRIRNVFYAVAVAAMWLVITSFFYNQKQIFVVPYLVALLSQMSILWKKRRAELENEGKKSKNFFQDFNLFLRALTLTVLFLIPFLLFDNSLSPWFSLVTCVIGIIMADGFFFSMTLFGQWDLIKDLRARMWADLLSTLIIFLVNYFWYATRSF